MPGTLRRLLSLFALALGLALWVPVGRAQEQASLIADRLEIASDSRLIASGHVEVFFKGRRLAASRVTYDRAADRLEIEGPIALTADDGRTVILASAAELSADMTEGILSGARLVLDRQLQMAAASLRRVAGRYTALDEVVASSCRICATSPEPLWEIRARRVVHDSKTRQIHFEGARFRMFGVPLAYIPRLRMPDPTLDRATGFLAPELRTTSDLGAGLRLPYFITLGDSRDLTVAPWLYSRGSTTLGLRYRQAFRTGTIEIEGAATHDRLTSHDLRGYLFAKGEFSLPHDFGLTIGLQVASDNAYLLDYGISDSDRLDSRIEALRVRRDELISARIVSFQSLRDEDDNDTLPSPIGDAQFQRRFSPGLIGGEASLRLEAHGRFRASDSPFDGPDPDTIADGRDVGRLSAILDWRRGFVLGPGIEVALLGEARADAWHIRQDAVFAGSPSRLSAVGGVELRWPWLRAGAGGSADVVEPVVQLLWAGSHGGTVPDEDSTLVEFDEDNLWSLDRFPGADAVEKGRRANVGLTWTHHAPGGSTMALTMGRVLRLRDHDQFGPASGLAGKRSHWLLALGIEGAGGLSASGRVVLADDLSTSKAEARLELARERLQLAASALYVVADATENRPEPTREIRLDGRWQVTPALAARMKGSYDFESGRSTLAGMGLEFRNECLAVDLSLSRRFTSSTSVSPTTSFGLSVDLIGFGSGTTAGPARRCY